MTFTDLLKLGSEWLWPSTPDNNTTVGLIDGALMLKAITAGPGFGSGIAGMALRVTGEACGDPAFVTRAHAYFWESDDCTWLMNLNATGLMIGGVSQDTGSFSPAYPQFRLDVRRGDLRVQNVTDTFIRADTAAANMPNVGFTVNQQGNPLWAIGVLPGMAGGGSGFDLVVMKFKNGAWTRVQTLGTY